MWFPKPRLESLLSDAEPADPFDAAAASHPAEERELEIEIEPVDDDPADLAAGRAPSPPPAATPAESEGGRYPPPPPRTRRSGLRPRSVFPEPPQGVQFPSKSDLRAVGAAPTQGLPAALGDRSSTPVAPPPEAALHDSLPTPERGFNVDELVHEGDAKIAARGRVPSSLPELATLDEGSDLEIEELPALDELGDPSRGSPWGEDMGAPSGGAASWGDELASTQPTIGPPPGIGELDLAEDDEGPVLEVDLVPEDSLDQTETGQWIKPGGPPLPPPAAATAAWSPLAAVAEELSRSNGDSRSGSWPPVSDEAPPEPAPIPAHAETTVWAPGSDSPGWQPAQEQQATAAWIPDTARKPAGSAVEQHGRRTAGPGLTLRGRPGARPEAPTDLPSLQDSSDDLPRTGAALAEPGRALPGADPSGSTMGWGDPTPRGAAASASSGPEVEIPAGPSDSFDGFSFLADDVPPSPELPSLDDDLPSAFAGPNDAHVLQRLQGSAQARGAKAAPTAAPARALSPIPRPAGSRRASGQGAGHREGRSRRDAQEQRMGSAAGARRAARGKIQRPSISESPVARELEESIQRTRQALQRDPDDEEARMRQDGLRDRLVREMLGVARGRRAVLKLVPKLSELKNLRINPRAGFLLFAVDGHTSIDDLLDLGNMDPIETMTLLADLLARGVVRMV